MAALFILGIIITTTLTPLISSQACLSYDEKKDYKSSSTVAQPAGTTLESCKALCYADASKCAYGFDYIYIIGSISQRCFISKNSDVTSSSGFTHFTCANIVSIITTAATQSNGVVTTSETDTGTKEYIWVVTKDSNSPKGILKQEYTTLAACQEACVKEKDTNCRFGIDFNPNVPAGSGCYFAINKDVNVGGYPGVNHYKLQKIGDDDACSFEETKDKGSRQGILTATARTLVECKAACKAKEECKYGFDYNTAVPEGSRCYLSTQMELTAYPGNSHYKYQCRKPCTWVKTENKNSPRGILQSSYNTLDTCQKACLANDNCKYGLDFVISNNLGTRCFFGTQDLLTDFAGVDHYKPNCEGVAGMCTYKEITGKNTRSGSLQGTLNTLDECKAQCTANKELTCKMGFDYVASAVTGARCWFSTQTTLNDAPGVSHFMLECSSNPGLTTPSPNGCTFVQKKGKNTRGGKAQTTVSTLEQCKSTCLSTQDIDCKYGFDWSPFGEPGYKCFFSTNTILSDYTPVDHYDIKCSASSGDCKFVEVADKNTRGSNAKPFNDLQKCKDECLAEKDDECKTGFDWHVSAPDNYKCWFSTQNALFDFAGVTHYKLNCGGLTTGVNGFQTTQFPVSGPIGFDFVLSKDMYSPGGKEQAENTLIGCKSKCAREIETTCKYGLDFNPNQPDGLKCYFSTIDSTFSGAGINHYKAVQKDVCIWVKKEDSNTAGGSKQTYTTLAECQSECIKLKITSCQNGLDWNTLNNECYFSTSNNVLAGAPGVDHYVCSTAGGPTVIPATTTLPSQKTTGLPTVNQCVWQESPDTNSPNGSVQTYNTLIACQTYCILIHPAGPSTSACPLGLDFNPTAPDGQKCFFSTIAGTTPSTGIKHYKCP